MLSELGAPSAPKIALLGSYAPRRCGIATFTHHLSIGLAKCAMRSPVVVAVNDHGQTYDYGPEVFAQIEQEDRRTYRDLAERLNVSDCDVVCVQHEFGIFGGMAGEYVLDFYRALKKPIATTFHTILEHPDRHQLRVTKAIANASAKVFVMSQRGREMLRSIYGVPDEKIQLIPHGVPDDYQGLNERARFRSGKTMLTFGLISPDKGIENVIRAMPKILESVPDARYVVLGATHPHILAHSGEKYRESLVSLACELGIESNVLFLNRFVSERELMLFLNQADIYVTPYLKLEQITSGTLAYAVGSGKAVISTPYWHAEELLADGCGILVPCRDPEAISNAAIELFTNEAHRIEIETKAKKLGSTMSWTAVAETYHDALLSTTANHQSEVLCLPVRCPAPVIEPAALCLDHLKLMTDDVGVFQHAIYSVPRYEEGYCTDDNARALLLMGLLDHGANDNPSEIRRLSARYLAFMAYAYNGSRGAFRNFLSISRTWNEEVGSEDSQGRAVMGLGVFAANSRDPQLRDLSSQLFDLGLKHAQGWTSPRSWAYAILGMEAMRRVGRLSPAHRELGILFSDRLHALYAKVSDGDWPWFEGSLTYCNARLPQAQLLVARWRRDKERWNEALASLDWLWQLQQDSNGQFQPIGSDRPFRKGKSKPRWDQQPVEAAATLSACLTAWHETDRDIWRERALIAYRWFLGANHLGISLYKHETGGCCDGLHHDRVNQNQGAESTISFLIAQEEMRTLREYQLRSADQGQEFRRIASA